MLGYRTLRDFRCVPHKQDREGKVVVFEACSGKLNMPWNASQSSSFLLEGGTHVWISWLVRMHLSWGFRVCWILRPNFAFWREGGLRCRLVADSRFVSALFQGQSIADQFCMRPRELGRVWGPFFTGILSGPLFHGFCSQSLFDSCILWPPN